MEECNEVNVKELYVIKEDVKGMDLKRLKDDIFTFSYQIYDQMYPDIEVPKNSISVGEIYESKNFFSCQVRFIKNGIIMKCNYVKEDGTFIFEIYEMTHCRHCMRVAYTEEEAGNNIYYHFLSNTDYIDEVKKENLEYLNKQKKELNKQKKKNSKVAALPKRKKIKKVAKGKIKQ